MSLTPSQVELPIAQRSVIALEFWPAWVTLVIGGKSDELARLRVSSATVLTGPAGEIEELPAAEETSGARLASLLGLQGDSVTFARAADGGNLSIGFESRRQLVVKCHHQFEAWEFTGPGMSIVCGPGGILSIWDGQADAG